MVVYQEDMGNSGCSMDMKVQLCSQVLVSSRALLCNIAPVCIVNNKGLFTLNFVENIDLMLSSYHTQKAPKNSKMAQRTF